MHSRACSCGCNRGRWCHPILRDIFLPTGDFAICLWACSGFVPALFWTSKIILTHLLQSHSLVQCWRWEDFLLFVAFKQQPPNTCSLRWDGKLNLGAVVEGKLQTGLERSLGGSLPSGFQAETMVWVLLWLSDAKHYEVLHLSFLVLNRNFLTKNETEEMMIRMNYLMVTWSRDVLRFCYCFLLYSHMHCIMLSRITHSRRKLTCLCCMFSISFEERGIKLLVTQLLSFPFSICALLLRTCCTWYQHNVVRVVESWILLTGNNQSCFTKAVFASQTPWRAWLCLLLLLNSQDLGVNVIHCAPCKWGCAKWLRGVNHAGLRWGVWGKMIVSDW